MPTALRFIPVAVQPKGMTQSHSQDVLSPTQATTQRRRYLARAAHEFSAPGTVGVDVLAFLL